MTQSIVKALYIAAWVVLVVMLGAFATHVSQNRDPQPTRPTWQVVGEGEITIQPPGTRASASTTLDADAFSWDLLVFRPPVLAPQPFDRREDGLGIEWDAAKDRTYIVRLTAVWWNDRLESYNHFWKYAPGPDPDPPPPPDGDDDDDDDDDPPKPPPLTGLAKEAWDWAQALSAPAKEQGPAFGRIFRDVGAKLGSGGYPPPNDWGAQVNSAHEDLSQRGQQMFLNEQWRTVWMSKYSQEMGRRWDAGEFNSAADVGKAMGQIADGLEALAFTRRPEFAL